MAQVTYQNGLKLAKILDFIFSAPIAYLMEKTVGSIFQNVLETEKKQKEKKYFKLFVPVYSCPPNDQTKHTLVTHYHYFAY